MFFLDTTILAKQLLPPNWRDARFLFIITLLAPFKRVMNDFTVFRKQTRLESNLSAQTIVVEYKIKQLTGLNYGVFISQTNTVNEFRVNIPVSAIGQKAKISFFLKKTIPAGRKYDLIFY